MGPTQPQCRGPGDKTCSEPPTLQNAAVNLLIETLAPDELDDLDELHAAAREWAKMTLLTLLCLLTLHAVVRLLARVFADVLLRPASDNSISLAIRLLLKVVFAVFPSPNPEPRPTRLREAALKVEALSRMRKGSVAVDPGPVLPKKKRSLAHRAASFGVGAVKQLLGSFVGLVALDLAVSCALPLALGKAGAGLVSMQPVARFALAFLVGARIVSPVADTVGHVVDDAISAWAAQDKETHGGGSYDHLSFVPNALVYLLWFVWAATLMQMLGFNVSGLWTALGSSGLLIGLALQHYAADTVAGFTLLADGRFKVGEVLTIGGVGTVTIRQVGLLQTRCTALFFGQMLTVPNSTLAKACITNESRIVARRLPVVVTVDADTPTAKLTPLPVQLRDGAKAAITKAGLGACTSLAKLEAKGGVGAADEAKGGGAEITGVDKEGITFTLTLSVPLPDDDRTVWKRVHTYAMLGCLGVLEANRIKLGRTHIVREPKA